MATDLFGKRIIKEEYFELIYRGSSFTGGKILVSSLYLELKALEDLLKDSVDLFIRAGKIGTECKDFQIFIEMKKGSFKEKIKVIFKHKKTIAVVGLIMPFLYSTYNHFLDNKGKVEGAFKQEIQEIEEDQNFKKNLKNIVSPLNNNDDNLFINNGEINININYNEKEWSV